MGRNHILTKADKQLLAALQKLKKIHSNPEAQKFHGTIARWNAISDYQCYPEPAITEQDEYTCFSHLTFCEKFKKSHPRWLQERAANLLLHPNKNSKGGRHTNPRTKLKEAARSRLIKAACRLVRIENPKGPKIKWNKDALKHLENVGIVVSEFSLSSVKAARADSVLELKRMLLEKNRIAP